MPPPLLQLFIGDHAVVLEPAPSGHSTSLFFAGYDLKKVQKRKRRTPKCLSKKKRHWVRCLANCAKKHGVPAELPIMAALVESNFTNPKGGDRDSVGMFQQRAPWGPYKIRHSPCKAGRMFIVGGQGGQPGAVNYKKKYLKKGPRHYGEWCQAVQVSAFPDRYQKRLRQARRYLKCAGVAFGLKPNPPKPVITSVSNGAKSDSVNIALEKS